MIKTIKFNTNNLSPLLSLVCSVVPQKAPLEILSNVRVKTKVLDGVGYVELLASDTETWLEVRSECIACDDGICTCVEPRVLLQAIRNLDGKEVTMTFDDEKNATVCKYDNGHFSLPCEDASTFPLPKKDDDSFTTMRIPSLTLSNFIRKTECAVATDALHPVMGGIHFVFGDDGMIAVATDARKLVKCKDKTIKGNNSEVTLPHKPSKVMLPMLDAMGDGDTTVMFNNSMFYVIGDNFKLATRLIDGKYPNYEAVIPKDNELHVTMQRSDFIASVKRVSTMMNASSELLVLDFHGNELTINAEDLDFSKSASESMPCESDFPKLEIGLKSSYLLQLLQNIDGERVRLELKSMNKPCVIKYDTIADSEEYISITMPILFTP